MEQKVLTPKKSFSRVGLALSVILVVTTVVQIICSVAVNVLSEQGNALASAPWLLWVVSFVPLYVVGVPVGMTILRRIPAEPKVEASSLGVGRLIKLTLMCFPIMYGGNILGLFISSFFSGGAAQNPLENFAFDNSPLKLLVMVILAPLVEEYIFRKQIIDRLGRYGEGLAIVFSGVVFGLFHGNLFQFFYACGLGMLFAYVYTRTRRLRYSFFLHAAVNFFGSVLGPWAVSQVDQSMLETMDAQSIAAMTEEELMAVAPGFAVFGGFILLVLALSLVGLILLLASRKKVELHPAQDQLPKGEGFKTAYLNVGVILLAVLCIALTVLILLS